MSNLTYPLKFDRAPYPELRARWIRKDAGTFELVTPWMQIDAVVPPEFVSAVADDLNALNGDKMPESMSRSVGALLERFADYPIYYIRPRRELVGCEASLPFFGELDLDGSPQELASRLLEFETSTAPNLDVVKLIYHGSLLESLHGPFVWPEDEILTLSEISADEDAYDPLSAVTALQRLTLKTRYEGCCLEELTVRLDDLARNNPNKYRDALIFLLRQSHLLTSRCETALAIACDRASPARSVVDEYRKSEKGHDCLTGAALNALGVKKVDEIPVAAAWMLALGALRLAANTDLLAFAALIGFFEGLPVATKSSLGQRLRELPNGGQEAARYVEKHHNINSHERHYLVPMDIAVAMPPVSSLSVRYAARLVEVVARGMQAFASDFLTTPH